VHGGLPDDDRQLANIKAASGRVADPSPDDAVVPYDGWSFKPHRSRTQAPKWRIYAKGWPPSEKGSHDARAMNRFRRH
jgi:hypothetical protein